MPPFFFYTSTVAAQLSNPGSSNITISSASVTGPGYSLSGLSFPVTLDARDSAAFQVTFAPLVLGHVDGTVGFTSNASSSTLYISLHGTSASPGMLSVSPSSVNFGTTATGSSVTQLEALTNTGFDSAFWHSYCCRAVKFVAYDPGLRQRIRSRLRLRARSSPAIHGLQTSELPDALSGPFR
jgi:hypothetical protein